MIRLTGSGDVSWRISHGRAFAPSSERDGHWSTPPTAGVDAESTGNRALQGASGMMFGGR